MKSIFKFNFVTGMVIPAAQKLSVLGNTNYPLELTGMSKEYDDSDVCVTECVAFVNSQLLELSPEHQLIVECNPFLAGQTTDLDESTLTYQKGRWVEDEILKVHAADISDETNPCTFSCSVFKIHVSTGFKIEQTETIH